MNIDDLYKYLTESKYTESVSFIETYIKNDKFEYNCNRFRWSLSIHCF